MLTLVSSSGFVETLDRLLDGITRRGLTVFVQIDHAAAARAVDMQLADEVVVVFGNPRGGTPLMQQDARIGIELPLRMLVWADGATAIVGYNDPRDLARSYDVGRHGPILGSMSSLLADLAHEATA